jgi:hypothetical protein
MEQVFSQLSKIKQIEPSESFYLKIDQRVRGLETVSYLWVSVAAGILMAIFSIEFFITLEKNQNASLTQVIIKTNNLLYNE